MHKSNQIIKSTRTAKILHKGRLINVNLERVRSNTLQTIADEQFKSNHLLESAYFPCTKKIGYDAFKDCILLKSITCSKLKSLGTQAFQGCIALKKTHFPNLLTIEQATFSHCTSLQSASYESVISLKDQAFKECTALTRALFPEAIAIGASAFKGCLKLTTLRFPKVKSISTEAFSTCMKLKTAHFPQVIEVGTHAFEFCFKLNVANFPRAKTLRTRAFKDCRNMYIGYFPQADTIETNAFEDCTELKYIVLPNTISQEERMRIGLDQRTVIIPSEYFEPSYLKYHDPNFFTRIFSQGLPIASALLSIARADLYSSKTLYQELKKTCPYQHQKIHHLIELLHTQSRHVPVNRHAHRPNENCPTKDQPKNDHLSGNNVLKNDTTPNDEKIKRKPNSVLAIEALSIFSKYYDLLTPKDYRRTQAPFDLCANHQKQSHFHQLKMHLFNLTGITQRDIDDFKKRDEDKLSQQVQLALKGI